MFEAGSSSYFLREVYLRWTMKQMTLLSSWESQGNFHPKHTTAETVVLLFMSFREERLRCLLLWVLKESDSWCSTEFPSLSLKILFLSCASCTGRKYEGRRKESRDDSSCEPGKYPANQSIYFINPACGGLCCVASPSATTSLLFLPLLISIEGREGICR